MKKYAWICCTLIALLFALCIELWQRGENERTKMEVMCKASVNAALEHFEAYSAGHKESDYLAGVAEFRSYMTAYLCLTDEANQAEYLWCNAVYGEMVLHPERIREHLSKLIDALRILSEDYDHPNGLQRIGEFANLLSAG